MFKKVLVANRGEIACRIIRTLSKMGIKSVAVYSDADENALHRQMADESVYIGPSSPLESYCNILKIISAIESSGADAVHPGFGFLSENANFVKMLKKKQITFIGPDHEVIAKMGDKIEAKKAANSAGVPTIRGFNDKLFGAAHAASVVESIGFPVMLKAAAGGGGKGMRIVHTPEEMASSYNLATNEALKSFNDGTIFIEKYIEEPRHIEIQVLCDKHGNVLCLGERECSIQRKHQKIIEEAPSVVVDERLRKSMYKACVKLLKQENYDSAGTVEFLLDKRGNFYFLEMNTRIQVEHTVTELITGLDIVELMIKSAAGFPLEIAQKDIVMNGWAIESRICAENPSKNFLPSGGVILRYHEPSGSNIRVDSGIKEGDNITSFYDSMLLKLCVYGKNRKEAIDAMLLALDNMIIEGVATNIEFLSSIFLNNAFAKGTITTNFIAEHYRDGFSGLEIGHEDLIVFVVVATYIYLSVLVRRFFPEEKNLHKNKIIRNKIYSYIKDEVLIIAYQNAKSEVRVKYFDEFLLLYFENMEISLSSDWWFGDDVFSGMLNDKYIGVYFTLISDNTYSMRYHGRVFQCKVYEEHVASFLKYLPESKEKNDGFLQITSPMNGLLSNVMVEIGDSIQIGDPVCVITAMKMENVIKSECNAIVDQIKIKPGELVGVNDVILTFKSAK